MVHRNHKNGGDQELILEKIPSGISKEDIKDPENMKNLASMNLLDKKITDIKM